MPEQEHLLLLVARICERLMTLKRALPVAVYCHLQKEGETNF
jgi:hypothetical protein